MNTENSVVTQTVGPLLPRNPRRISPDTLGAVKNIPIIDVIGLVVPLRRSGAQLTGLCPFHSEKTPSFTVHPAKNLFYCHGCNVGGDSVAFVMRFEDCGFVEAVTSLAQRFGIPVRDEVPDHAKLAILRELRQIEKRIHSLVLAEQIRCANELQRLRQITRSHSIDTMPADIYDLLRRADVRYALVALVSHDAAVEFLCLSPAEQARRIDQALEDGYVSGDRYFWEVPLQ